MADTKVEALLDKLSLSPTEDTNKPSAYQAELKEAGFGAFFKPISDHGYFAWRPKGSYKNLADIASTSEITSLVNPNVKPKHLVPLSSISGRLPLAFRTLPAQEHVNKFPYGRFEVACLYVASKCRGIDLESFDFVFGGSTLEMLARMDTSSPYMATRVPGTNTILVAKCKEYVQNYADFGFQFERLVTGESVSAKAEIEFVEHLHSMSVGSHRVLFRAETDAILDDEPVEVKASNPRYWGTKVTFQMVSSGSPMLCHGEKRRGALTSVKLLRLSEVARDAFRVESYSKLKENIQLSMNALKDQMKDAKDDEVFKLSFTGGSLRLLPCTTRNAVLLPPPEIVRSLLYTRS